MRGMYPTRVRDSRFAPFLLFDNGRNSRPLRLTVAGTGRFVRGGGGGRKKRQNSRDVCTPMYSRNRIPSQFMFSRYAYREKCSGLGLDYHE